MEGTASCIVLMDQHCSVAEAASGVVQPLLHRLLQGSQLRANSRPCCPHQFVQPAGPLPRGVSGPVRHSQGDESPVCPPVLD